MTHKYSQPCATCLSVLVVFRLIGAIPGQESIGQESGGQDTPQSAAALPSSSKLTPEQRQQRKDAKLKKEMEEEQRRLESFGVIPDDDHSPLANAYRKATEEFRKATADFADMHARLQFRTTDEIPPEQNYQWLETLTANHDKLAAWREQAAALYSSNPKRYESVGLLLREMLIADGITDRDEHWDKAARALIEAQRLVTDDVLLNAGYIGFSTCDWELAAMAWTPLAQQGKLSEVEIRMLQEMPAIAQAWEIEKERLREDESKNNPRVEFLTTKGVIEIELFEDDAPEAVANFIYLIEKGYYNRKPLFLVKKHWLVQTGCEKGDGKGTAGYTIGFEANAPTRRNHYRGYLAVPLAVNTETKSIAPDSGGAQFYFTYLPLPLFDGKHTVFGRIVKGIETLGLFKEINLTDENERKDATLRPDNVVSARVLRKRDHEYLPKPVLGRLPR